MQNDDPAAVGMYDVTLTVTPDDPDIQYLLPSSDNFEETFTLVIHAQGYKPTRYTYCNGANVVTWNSYWKLDYCGIVQHHGEVWELNTIACPVTEGHLSVCIL